MLAQALALCSRKFDADDSFDKMPHMNAKDYFNRGIDFYYNRQFEIAIALNTLCKL